MMGMRSVRLNKVNRVNKRIHLKQMFDNKYSLTKILKLI